MKKSGLPIGVTLLIGGWLQFILVYLLGDSNALKSSIYTYYQSEYYSHLSAGQLPWINFKFEYPPLAAFTLFFPAFFSGLSVFQVSILRSLTCLACSIAVIFFVTKNTKVSDSAKLASAVAIGATAIVVPGFYYGLFDWQICLINVLLAIALFAPKEGSKWTAWPLIFLGGSVKLMHFLAMPFLVRKKDFSSSGFKSTVVATLLLHLPFLTIGFHGLRYFLAYHRLRSIDCFSTYATLLEIGQRLGFGQIQKNWAYGALELQGRLAQIFAKASLPLFLIILAFLVWKFGPRTSIKTSFAAFNATLILYPVLSKVSQNNYCIWVVAAVVALWIAGFDQPEFMRKSSILVALSLVCGFLQDRWFSDFEAVLVPWRSILVAIIRHVVSLLLVYSILHTAQQGAPQDQSKPAAT